MSGATSLGTVAELWRYPVKSLRGERLERARFTARGLEGDRAYAMRERASGRIVSGKRFDGVLAARAATATDRVTVMLPDGSEMAAPDAAGALGAMLGVDVDVVARADGDEGIEISGEETRTFRSWPGSFFDAAPVHVVTTATLAHLRALHPEGDFDVRRFRPNILVDAAGAGPVEQAWIGSTIEIGGARFEVLRGCARCVMTTQPQSELPRDRDILRTVARDADNIVGVLCTVVADGEVAVGDAAGPVRPGS